MQRIPHSVILREIPIKSEYQRAEEDSGIAGSDAVHDSLFIRTDEYHALCDDRFDVFLGRKGTGKSVLLGRFDEGSDLPPDVIGIALGNVGTDASFRKLLKVLRQGSDAPEGLRNMWLLYFGVTMANTLIRLRKSGDSRMPITHATEAKLTILLKFLKEADLPRIAEGNAQISSAILTFISRLRPKLGINDGGNLELGVELAEMSGVLPDLDTSAIDLLKLVDDVLKAANRRCWLLLDNLDEILDGTDRELEAAAFHSLLRAQLDTTSLRDSRYRVKLLMRDDVFRLITNWHGLPGATRMRRVTLHWPNREIARFIARRACSSAAFRQAFQMSSNDAEINPNRVTQVLFPERVEGQDPLSWLCGHTRDGAGGNNPRNVMGLLSYAFEYERQSEAAARRWAPEVPLLGLGSLLQAFSRLSDDRYSDTILSEYDMVSSQLRRLERGPDMYANDEELGRRIRCDASSGDFDYIVDNLVESGVLRRTSEDGYVVPLLYRPALRVSTRRPGAAAALD